MLNQPLQPPVGPATFGAQMEAAKQRAVELRRQAIRDFWDDADAAAARALRAANRFAHRLAQHCRQRNMEF